MSRINHSGRAHLLTIEMPTVTQTSTGAPKKTWDTFATVYGQIAAGSSREFFVAKATHSEISHEITIRYIPGITSDMRIRFGLRVFDIAAVPQNPGEMNEWLVLMGHEIDSLTGVTGNKTWKQAEETPNAASGTWEGRP